MFKLKFIWSKGFDRRTKKMFSAVQKQIDRDCIEFMTPLVPVGADRFENSGDLRDSVRNPKPGVITYDAGPIKGGRSIAWQAYYLPMNHRRSGNPNATHRWFEYMKKKDGARILKNAATVAKECK